MTTTPTIVLYILLLKYNKNLDDDAFSVHIHTHIQLVQSWISERWKKTILNEYIHWGSWTKKKNSEA